MEQSEHELYGEVRPVGPGKSAEQEIIEIPFDGTIKFASYTPNDYLHVAEQGSGRFLRDLQLIRRGGTVLGGTLADIKHHLITLHREQEQPMDIDVVGGNPNVKKGDKLLWWSSPRPSDEDQKHPQSDQGDPGGTVKVVLVAAPGQWFL